jgi:hypothetical protein
MLKKGMIFFALLALLSISYVYYMPPPTFDTVDPTFKLQKDTTISSGEGRRIVEMVCYQCHYNYESKTLAGRMHGNPERVGRFFSGNITKDSTTGIGTWTDEELYHFLRTGVNREGHFVFDMPKYPNLSERDLLSIISYLRSNDPLVAATYYENPPAEYSLLTKAALHFIFQPAQQGKHIISEVDTTNLEEWGKYLATAKFSCFDCHSGHSLTNNYSQPEKSWRYFQGGNPHADEDGNTVYSLNLTPDKVSGIGKWTAEDFSITLRSGVKPNGESLRNPMFPFHLLTDQECNAIFAYLNTLAPVSNRY